MVDATLADLRDGAYGAELDRGTRRRATPSARAWPLSRACRARELVIVLGSGLGGVVELLDPAPRVRIGYDEIPNAPTGSVAGHAGELIAGSVRGSRAVILWGGPTPQGYSQRESTLLLRAILALGAHIVVLTNAAGGLDPEYVPGDVMLISDHLNLSGGQPRSRPEPRPIRRGASRP